MLQLVHASQRLRRYLEPSELRTHFLVTPAEALSSLWHGGDSQRRLYEAVGRVVVWATLLAVAVGAGALAFSALLWTLTRLH